MTLNSRKASLVLVSLVIVAPLVVAGPVGGGQGIDLVVSPRLSRQPAVINIRVSVEPSTENRAIRVVAESPDYFRSSQVQLDGTSASRTSLFQYRDLPAGSYEIRGVLIGPDGRERAEVGRLLTVVPR